MIKNKRMYLIILLGLLFVPLIGNILLPRRIFSDLENRYLASTVNIDKELLKSGVLAERLEAFVQDQFPLRENFINLKSDLEVLLQKKENNGIYYGKDGYLFGKPKNFQEAIFKKNLDALVALSNESSLPIGIFIVPPSQLVLTENLPKYYVPWREEKYYEEIMKALKPSGAPHGIEVLSLHREEGIYFRTDHHWTQRGAYEGYKALMESMDLQPVKLASYEPVLVEGFQGTFYSKFRGNIVGSEPFIYYEAAGTDLMVYYPATEIQEDRIIFEERLSTRDKYAAYLNGNDPLIEIRNEDAIYDEKVLVLKDSNANAMSPFLVDTFKEVHYLDLRYFNLPLSDYLEENGFDRVLCMYGMDSVGEDENLMKLAK